LVPGHDELLQDLDEEVEHQRQQDDGEQRSKDAGCVELSRRIGEQVAQALVGRDQLTDDRR
jgi:hypothetical protein